MCGNESRVYAEPATPRSLGREETRVAATKPDAPQRFQAIRVWTYPLALSLGPLPTAAGLYCGPKYGIQKLHKVSELPDCETVEPIV